MIEIPVYGGPMDGEILQVQDTDHAKNFNARCILADGKIRRSKYELEIREINGRMEYIFKHKSVTDADK